VLRVRTCRFNNWGFGPEVGLVLSSFALVEVALSQSSWLTFFLEKLSCGGCVWIGSSKSWMWLSKDIHHCSNATHHLELYISISHYTDRQMIVVSWCQFLVQAWSYRQRLVDHRGTVQFIHDRDGRSKMSVVFEIWPYISWI